MNRKPGFALHSALIAMLLMLLTLLPSSTTYAQWTGEGILVSDQVHDKQQVVSDGQGGVWIAWLQTPWATPDIRVQHYDSEGYPSFGPEGLNVIEDSLEWSGYWVGAFPSDDGGVIVGFLNYTLNPDTDFGIYAQKFNLEGERLFGLEGAEVLDLPYYQSFKRACSDGQGGLWAYYNEGFGDRSIYICGINSDGTQKVENGIYLGEDIYDTPMMKAGLCHDEEGGVFVAWVDTPGEDPPYRTIYKHVLNDGTLEVDSARTVYTTDNGIESQLYSIPDNEGGFYLNTKGSWYLQRVASDGSHPWGINGAFEIGGYHTYISSPAIMAENRVFFSTTNTAVTYLIGAMADNGDPAFGDEYTVPIDESIYNHDLYPVLTVPAIDGYNAYII